MRKRRKKLLEFWKNLQTFVQFFQKFLLFYVCAYTLLTDSGLNRGDTNDVMPDSANSINVLKSCVVTPGILCPAGPKIEIIRSLDNRLWANSCCLYRHMAAKPRPQV
jgi:hypothetical protein